MTISVTRLPVSGRVHSLSSLGSPLGHMLHDDDHAFDAGHEIHGAAHALYHLAGNHPVCQIAALGNLHRAEDRQIDMSAPRIIAKLSAEEK